ncbi:MAG: Radical SAM domain protein [Petrotoga mobilis]|nr:MAG: Radical SAM domain protein [Petrotoga mobilis]
MRFLKNSKQNYTNETFSHIYIEKDALNYSLTNEVISKLNKSKIIYIDNYNEIFSRKNQNPFLQKLSPSLILAVKKGDFIYKGSNLCHNFEQQDFYYTNFIVNCLYDCDYCYLKGMNFSSHILFFVNLSEYFNELRRLIVEKGKLYLSISYDSDILLFDGIYPFLKEWIKFAKENPLITIEIRTKTSNYKKFLNYSPIDNLIITWSISPQEVISKYEKNTPSLERRLIAISQLLKKGWKINLALDPILYIGENWSDKYKEFINSITENINIKEINAITLGVFRIPADYLKRFKKFFESSISFFPYQTINGVSTYPEELKNEMIKFVYSELKNIFDKTNIYIL